MLSGWLPGLFKSYDTEAANGYQFEYPQKKLRAGLILRYIGMLLIPTYVVYLYDLPALPAIALGASITVLMHIFGFFWVVPIIEYIFNTKLSRRKKIIRYLVEYGILFIGLGVSNVFTAIAIVTTLVCFVGGFFLRDPIGFTKGAANGFIDLLLIQIFCIEFSWPNVGATIVACCLSLFALFTEEKLREH